MSITFDPFNVLSVPLPKFTNKQEQTYLIVTYYPSSLKKAVLKFKVNVDLRFGRGSDVLI